MHLEPSEMKFQCSLKLTQPDDKLISPVVGWRECRSPQRVITATQMCFAACALLNWLSPPLYLEITVNLVF